MKVAVLGGGGFRTPIVHEALRSVAADADVESVVLHDVDGERLRMVPLHLRHACANDVAWEPAADEEDKAVQPRHAVAAVGERLDPEVELLVLPDGRGHPTSIGARPWISPAGAAERRRARVRGRLPPRCPDVRPP